MTPSSPPACAWCGASLQQGERLAGRIRCRACGTATTAPWPSATELEKAYAEWYRPATGRFSGIGDRVLRRTRASLAGRIDRIAPPGPVLDVGAGSGGLLAALREREREAIGLEREASEPGMREGDVAEQEKGAWAAVVFWHSLEHLPEPGQAIEAVSALLRAEGVVILAVPNSASIQAHLFGDRWFALDLPRHLVHLTAPALLQRLRSAGLRVERVSYVRGGQVVFGWLHGLVALLPGQMDLYEAIRRAPARAEPMSVSRRLLTLTAAMVLLPMAALGSLVEVVLRRGGTVYVEARRA